MSRTALIAVVLMVQACGNANTSDGEIGPSPVVLQDTSPSQLSVFVALNMGGYDPVNRNRSLLDFNFQHAGHPVEFVADEQVTCNGVPLRRFSRGSFESSLAVPSIADKTMSCAYAWHGQSAPLAIPIPPTLVILAPTDHETVSRGPHTIVRFSGVIDSNLWVVALSPNVKAVAKPNDVTTTSATLDTTALGSGDGSISLTDADNIPLQGIVAPAFHSVSGIARRMTMVAVVWS